MTGGGLREYIPKYAPKMSSGEKILRAYISMDHRRLNHVINMLINGAVIKRLGNESPYVGVENLGFPVNIKTFVFLRKYRYIKKVSRVIKYGRPFVHYKLNENSNYLLLKQAYEIKESAKDKKAKKCLDELMDLFTS